MTEHPGAGQPHLTLEERYAAFWWRMRRSFDLHQQDKILAAALAQHDADPRPGVDPAEVHLARMRLLPKGSRSVGRKRSGLLLRDGHGCYLCGKVLPLDEYEVEHIIPVSQGGTDESRNLALACQNCNRVKSGNFVAFDIADRTPTYLVPATLSDLLA